MELSYLPFNRFIKGINFMQVYDEKYRVVFNNFAVERLHT